MFLKHDKQQDKVCNLTAYKAPCRTANNLFEYVYKGKKCIVKVYVAPRRRTKFKNERNAISQWQKEHFNVPEIFPIRLNSISGPHLVLELIEGLSLKEYLTSADKNASEKLATIDLLFREIARRHKIAVQSGNPALIHYDLNSKNIIWTNRDFYFVDFETGPKSRHSVLRAAGNEVLTICKWIVSDIGADFLKPVIAQLVNAYAEQQNILRCVASSVLDRHFQFYHRFKDRKRKIASAGSVTKYDIADALAAMM